MTTIKRIALLSLAVPWHDRPTNGLYNVEQAKALKSLGIDTHIFTVAPCLPNLLRPLGGPFARQLNRRSLYRFDGVPIHTLRAPVAYPHIVRSRLVPRAPHLVSGTFRQAAGGPMMRAMENFCPDALIVHGMQPWSDLVAHLRQNLQIPTLVIEHSADDVHALERHRSLARFVRNAASSFDTVACVNTAQATILAAIGVHSPLVLTNGIASRPHIERTRTPGRFNILTAGQFIPRKGHAQLIEAFSTANLPDARLRIVGDPPPRLKHLIRRSARRNQIECLPLLTNTQLMAEMAASDLFALPSWSESFGLVFAEAMSVGTPFLACADAGIADHVTHGEHGWLVPPRHVGEIAGVLEHASVLHTRDRERMAEAGRRLAAERFSWKSNALTVLRALQQAANCKSLARPEHSAPSAIVHTV